MRANVEIPALEIAAGSRVDRRVTKCLSVAGQDNFLCGGTFFRKDHGHGWNGSFFRSLLQTRFGCRSRMNAGVNQESKSSERGCPDKDCGSVAEAGASVKSIGSRVHWLSRDRLWLGSGHE